MASQVSVLIPTIDRYSYLRTLLVQLRTVPDPGPGFAGSVVRHPEARPGQVLDEPDLFSGL